MPNGFYGSKEQWAVMETPLLDLDPILTDYAKRHNLRVEKNYHDWPSRSLQWSRDGMNRSIQLYPEKEHELVFSLWLVAWQDRGGKRYWKNHYLKKDVLITEITAGLEELLDQARTTVNSWPSADLQPA